MSEHIDALKEHLERKGLTDMETEAHVDWVERENAELLRVFKRDRIAYQLLIDELRKDKERLDWLLENDCLRDWIDHGVAYGLNEGREYIDAAMKED